MPSCFISMPSAAPFDAYYKVLARAVVRIGLEPIRADTIDRPRAIKDQIRTGVAAASICIVDLTGRNSTAMYVLGMAHGMGKPVIQLVQSQEDLPFDMRFTPHIVYRPGIARWEDMLSVQLQSAVRESIGVISGTAP